jgi:hypothetical protein
MDPRRRFAETLISALKSSKLPIVVYSGYEERCLKELAGEFSDLAKPIDKIVKRLFDLLPVVRSSVYHRNLGSATRSRALRLRYVLMSDMTISRELQTAEPPRRRTGRWQADAQMPRRVRSCGNHCWRIVSATPGHWCDCTRLSGLSPEERDEVEP